MANRKGKNAPARTTQPTAPDADYWRGEVEWELHDAALLLKNIEPRPDRGDKLKELLRGFDDRREEMPVDNDGKEFFELARIVRLARTAYENGDLVLQVGYLPDGREQVTVQRRALLLWANGKGYELPKALAAFAAVEREQKRSESATEKATKASADKRRALDLDRDRRIHDAAAAGKKPKQIGADENLSASRVRDILRSPRP